MSFLGKMSCKVGLHDWSDWFYQKSGDCTQIKRCNRDCGASSNEKRVEHSMGEWNYPQLASCENIRVCSRCSHTETRTLHPWGQWIYEEDARCDQIRTCPRCHATETRTKHEEWTDWEYLSPDSCEQQSKCKRCGELREREANHLWDSWHYDAPKSCDQLRFCTRCHRKEVHRATEDKDHDRWSELNYAYPNVCNFFERHCLRCGMQQSGPGFPMHQYSEWRRTSHTRLERVCRRCHHRDTKYERENDY